MTDDDRIKLEPTWKEALRAEFAARKAQADNRTP